MRDKYAESEFNCFEILSKGDKELVHSAMLAYLLNNSRNFAESLLGDLRNFSDLDFRSEENVLALLTKSQANLAKKQFKKERQQRIAIDLAHIVYQSGQDNDDEPKKVKALILIETKFKCFPDEDQLANYDACVDQLTLDHVKKILVCFVETNIVGWTCVTFDKVVDALDKSMSCFQGDEATFVAQYKAHLKKYLEARDNLTCEKSTKMKSFLNGDIEKSFNADMKKKCSHENIENRIYVGDKGRNANFWRNIVYWSVREELEKCKSLKDCVCELFNEKVTVMDISPFHWYKEIAQRKQGGMFHLQLRNRTLELRFTRCGKAVTVEQTKIITNPVYKSLMNCKNDISNDCLDGATLSFQCFSSVRTRKGQAANTFYLVQGYITDYSSCSAMAKAIVEFVKIVDKSMTEAKANNM